MPPPPVRQSHRFSRLTRKSLGGQRLLPTLMSSSTTFQMMSPMSWMTRTTTPTQMYVVFMPRYRIVLSTICRHHVDSSHFLTFFLYRSSIDLTLSLT